MALVTACGQGSDVPVTPTPPPSPTPGAVTVQVTDEPSAPLPVPSPTITTLATATPQPTPSSAVTPHHVSESPPQPSPTPVQKDDSQINPATEPPDRDLFELALRLRPGLDEPVSRIANPSPVTYQEGHSETFWVVDAIDSTAYTVQATLVLVSEHAYWYVDDAIEIAEEDLKRAADAFESHIHPKTTGAFGDIWNPGVDNDPRLTVLNTPLRGVAGYYGSQDEYPRQTHPRSNQREMIYLDGEQMKPGSSSYLSVLTHEFQHAIHWNQDAGEDAWINEGMSEVARALGDYRLNSVNSFMRNSSVQLNYWPNDLGASVPHYGASALFLSYLAQHYGGYESLKELARQEADGVNGIEAHLWPYGKTFPDVFKDWVIANYLDAPEGPYGYPDRRVRVRDVDMIFDYSEESDTLPQFAARYIDLRLKEGDALVSFQGESEVAQIATGCHSGRYCWWGNRGDSIDSTLERKLDLTSLMQATLEFWTWFDIEEDWDYAYVEVSTDGGKSWTILEGKHTTSENPVGDNFGDGLTGSSGRWVQERMDLSPYAGNEVLVRFEYITDDAVYLDGIVIDDVAVPELGFFDDAEQDQGWQAEGFERIDNVLPQDYAVQLIEVAIDGEVSVSDINLDEQMRGQTLIQGFGSRLEHAVIVVAPLTRDTHQPAQYTLIISPPSVP